MGLDILHIKLDLRNNENIDYLEIEDFKSNLEFLNKFLHLIDDGKIYYSKKGQLRKQVNENFIKVFENEKLYFLLEEVKRAKLHLEVGNNGNQIELEKEFQKSFIDNFIEGESIFFISY